VTSVSAAPYKYSTTTTTTTVLKLKYTERKREGSGLERAVFDDIMNEKMLHYLRFECGFYGKSGYYLDSHLARQHGLKWSGSPASPDMLERYRKKRNERH